MAKNKTSTNDERLAMRYEYLMQEAWNCNKAYYIFACKEFFNQPNKYNKGIPAYLQTCLILLSKRDTKYKQTFLQYIKMLDEDFTYRCAKSILLDMENRKMPHTSIK